LLIATFAVLHLYINFFIPVQKLEEKTRIGSKVKRIHDAPQTPYARVLASPQVPEEYKAQLRETYALLDLIDLHRQIVNLQKKLLSSVSMISTRS
jgi:hypothetical protein